MQLKTPPESNHDKRRVHRLRSAFLVETVKPESDAIGNHHLEDISIGGLRMRSAEPLDAGQVVRMRFPSIDSRYAIEGRVVWCQGRTDRQFDIGIRFQDEAPALEDRIFTRIREIETYRETIRDLHGRDLSPDDAAREWLNKFSVATGM